VCDECIDTDDLEIPTIEQAQEFKRIIDTGRAAAGLPPLEFLEYDKAISNSATACLSATNLFNEIGCDVGSVTVDFNRAGQSYSKREAALKAIGSAPITKMDGSPREDRWEIPKAILIVTNPFDANLGGLRTRLVEAGVVAPRVEPTPEPKQPVES